MKTVNKIFQVLAAAAGIAAVVLFFVNFATVVTDNVGTFQFSGTQLGFGIDTTDPIIAMRMSSRILFVFLLTVITAICSCLNFTKSKNVKFAAPAFGLISAIYMLVISLSHPTQFVDDGGIRSLAGVTVTSVSYELPVYIVTAVLFAGVIFAVAHLLIDDAIACAGDKNKLTIPKRVVRFLRDYKSEVHKIVWPKFGDVAKNTLIVLIICVIVGAFIWLVDLGLTELLKLIW